MCTPVRSGNGHAPYVYDIGKKCVSPVITAAARAEGVGCQPGLAETDTDYLANTLNMLIQTALGEPCDRDQARSLTVDELHQHVHVLRALLDRQYTRTKLLCSATMTTAVVLASLVSASPLLYGFWLLHKHAPLPPVHICAIALLIASGILLLLAVIRKFLKDYSIEWTQRHALVDTVMSDVVASGDRTKVQKRLNAHLQSGNLHAIFELHKSRRWSLSRQLLVAIGVVGGMLVAGASAYQFDVFTAIRELRQNSQSSLMVGGSLKLPHEKFHIQAMSAFASVVAVAVAIVAWQDLV